MRVCLGMAARGESLADAKRASARSRGMRKAFLHEGDQRSPRSARGARAPGASGTARAYGLVSATGALTRSKNATVAHFLGSGQYCMRRRLESIRLVPGLSLHPTSVAIRQSSAIRTRTTRRTSSSTAHIRPVGRSRWRLTRSKSTMPTRAGTTTTSSSQTRRSCSSFRRTTLSHAGTRGGDSESRIGCTGQEGPTQAGRPPPTDGHTATMAIVCLPSTRPPLAGVSARQPPHRASSCGRGGCSRTNTVTKPCRPPMLTRTLMWVSAHTGTRDWACNRPSASTHAHARRGRGLRQRVPRKVFEEQLVDERDSWILSEILVRRCAVGVCSGLSLTASG
jgi:hypothetical protein